MSYRRLSFNLQPRTGVFALLLFITLNAAGVMAESAPVAPPQEAAPPMTSVIADETGAELLMADLAGRPVLVNFWATWCAPCVAELPALSRAAAALANDDIVVMLVSIRETVGRYRQGPQTLGAARFLTQARSIPCQAEAGRS